MRADLGDEDVPRHALGILDHANPEAFELLVGERGLDRGGIVVSARTPRDDHESRSPGSQALGDALDRRRLERQLIGAELGVLGHARV